MKKTITYIIIYLSLTFTLTNVLAETTTINSSLANSSIFKTEPLWNFRLNKDLVSVEELMKDLESAFVSYNRRPNTYKKMSFLEFIKTLGFSYILYENESVDKFNIYLHEASGLKIIHKEEDSHIGHPDLERLKLLSKSHRYGVVPFYAGKEHSGRIQLFELYLDPKIFDFDLLFNFFSRIEILIKQISSIERRDLLFLLLKKLQNTRKTLIQRLSSEGFSHGHPHGGNVLINNSQKIWELFEEIRIGDISEMEEKIKSLNIRGILIDFKHMQKPYYYMKQNGNVIIKNRNKLLGSCFSGAVFPEGKIFNGMNFFDIDHDKRSFFIHTESPNAIFRNSNLSLTVFDGANLQAVIFEDTVIFQETTLKAADFDYPFFRFTNFEHAIFPKNIDLGNGLFRFSNMRNVQLINANLEFASFLLTDLRYANLSGSELSHADFTGTNLVGANLLNVIFENGEDENKYEDFIAISLDRAIVYNTIVSLNTLAFDLKNKGFQFRPVNLTEKQPTTFLICNEEGIDWVKENTPHELIKYPIETYSDLDLYLYSPPLIKTNAQQKK